MIEVRIDNISEIQNQLKRLEDGVENRYLLMRRLSETMHTAVKLNFRYAGRPKWLGLKYRAGKPLTDTGRLKDSFSTITTPPLSAPISSMPLFITSVGRLGATAKFGFRNGNF